jgi:hypothetical protein
MCINSSFLRENALDVPANTARQDTALIREPVKYFSHGSYARRPLLEQNEGRHSATQKNNTAGSFRLM